MTKFAFEVPLRHLEDFDMYQQINFALSFLCEDFYYVNYIKSKDRFTILDNSFNELQTPETAEHLVACYEKINADLIIAPDSDGWSIAQLNEAYKEVIEYVDENGVLVVVKNEEEYNWRESVGWPKYCTTYLQRPNLPEFMLVLCTHFLGLVDVKEVKAYNPVTLDTAIPIKLAIQGKTIDDWIKEGCPHIYTNKDYFDLKLDPITLKLAQENCKWLLVNIAH